MYEQTPTTNVEALGGSIVLIVAFSLWAFITICWILVPFFILGTNRRLDTVAQELRLLNSTLLTFAQRTELHLARANSQQHQSVQATGHSRSYGGSPGWPEITE